MTKNFIEYTEQPDEKIKLVEPEPLTNGEDELDKLSELELESLFQEDDRREEYRWLEMSYYRYDHHTTWDDYETEGEEFYDFEPDAFSLF